MNESMTCDEYLSGLDFGSLIDELYWERENNVTDKLWEFMKEQAKRDNVILTDEEDYNYDKPLWDVYQYPEKGLS